MIVLEFVFSSFWTFAGTGILIAMFSNGVVEIIESIRRK